MVLTLHSNFMMLKQIYEFIGIANMLFRILYLYLYSFGVHAFRIASHSHSHSHWLQSENDVHVPFECCSLFFLSLSLSVSPEVFARKVRRHKRRNWIDNEAFNLYDTWTHKQYTIQQVKSNRKKNMFPPSLNAAGASFKYLWKPNVANSNLNKKKISTTAIDVILSFNVKFSWETNVLQT